MKNISIGAFLLAITVALGAFGAHGLKELINDDALKIFETGIKYQFYHAIGILICGILNKVYQTEGFNLTAKLFIAGIIFFSGSLYILSFKEYIENVKYIGPVTPIGGVCFIAGWLAMALRSTKLT